MRYIAPASLLLVVWGLFTLDWFKVGFGILIFLTCFAVDLYKKGDVALLEPASKLTYLVAAIVSGLLGFLATPALISIVIGSVIFTIGYFLARAPQIHRLVTVDGKNPVFLFLYMTLFQCILSGACYGLGRIFS